MQLLILIRHGQTDDNALKKVQGHLPTPLNNNGKDQARRSAEVLVNLILEWKLNSSHIVNFISSDLRRANETAEIILQKLNTRLQANINKILSVDLREFYMGNMQGYTIEQFANKYKQEYNEFLTNYAKDPIYTNYIGGESRYLVAKRAFNLVNQINNDYLTNKSPALTIWISHGGIIDIILELLNTKLIGNKRVIGNGDILILKPSILCEQSLLAQKFNCDVGWNLFKHVEIGDSISAQINPAW